MDSSGSQAAVILSLEENLAKSGDIFAFFIDTTRGILLAYICIYMYAIYIERLLIESLNLYLNVTYFVYVCA